MASSTPLQTAWTFWYHRKSKTATESYEDSVKSIASFRTVEEFWQVWSAPPPTTRSTDASRPRAADIQPSATARSADAGHGLSPLPRRGQTHVGGRAESNRRKVHHAPQERSGIAVLGRAHDCADRGAAQRQPCRHLRCRGVHSLLRGRHQHLESQRAERCRQRPDSPDGAKTVAHSVLRQAGVQGPRGQHLRQQEGTSVQGSRQSRVDRLIHDFLRETIMKSYQDEWRRSRANGEQAGADATKPGATPAPAAPPGPRARTASGAFTNEAAALKDGCWADSYPTSPPRSACCGRCRCGCGLEARATARRRGPPVWRNLFPPRRRPPILQLGGARPRGGPRRKDAQWRQLGQSRGWSGAWGLHESARIRHGRALLGPARKGQG
eukprot:scaffold6_cov245-Pinguiococcus_pyrenoidosus.AAC.8